MPLVQVTIMEGRTQEKKEKFCMEVAEAAVRNLDVNLSQVRVVINEVPAEHWTIGGVSVARLKETKAKGE